MDKKPTSSTSSETRRCLISNKPVTKILDLGMHPYADTFIPKQMLGLTEPVFPLQCYLNSDSGQVQLGYMTHDYDRYNLYTYSYTSSNSKFAKAHWDAYYKQLKQTLGVSDSLVVEIGSNDGYLAYQFLQDGNTVVGVDSSALMCKIAEEKGLTTVNSVFNSDTAAELLEGYGKASLIIANNVFNHSNNPVDFAVGIANLLDDNGVFVFELPYWKCSVESGKFDQVYHEHVSYFTIKSSFNLLAKAGLNLVDFEVVDYHGGSIRVFAKKAKQDIVMVDKVQRTIKEETSMGLFDPDTYRQWQADLVRSRDKFLGKLYTIKYLEPEVPIIGVGAAAKANTFLNFYNLDSSVLDYVTDSSEHKQGKYTPLTRIPIVGDEVFAQYPKAYALILSWNISNDLKDILLNINPNIKFLTL